MFYGFSTGTPVHFVTSPTKWGAYWLDASSNVAGAFLEGGTPEENAAIQALVTAGKVAPSADELATQGLGFALAAKM